MPLLGALLDAAALEILYSLFCAERGCLTCESGKLGCDKRS